MKKKMTRLAVDNRFAGKATLRVKSTNNDNL